MQAADARLGKAFVLIILDVWSRGGSIPASHAYISNLTGLELSYIAQNKEVLFGGLIINTVGRFELPGLSEICATMQERFGKEMEMFAVSALMAVQDPSNMSLAIAETSSGKSVKGLTLYPRGGFSADQESIDCCLNTGYQHGDISALLMKFKDFSLARSTKNKDWQAAFRMFVQKEFEFSRRSSTGQGGFFPSVQTSSKGDALAMRNLSMLMGGVGR